MKKFSIILILILLSSCVDHEKQRMLIQQKQDEFYDKYPKEEIAKIESILVLPPVNSSTDVSAPNYFFPTISYPIVEKGYYVMPINLTRRVMEDEGMSDINMVYQKSPTILGKLFGADAVLYTEIIKWESLYIGLGNRITVTFKYSLKDSTNGRVLWANSSSVYYDSNQESSQSGGGIVGLLVQMAVKAALSKTMENTKYFELSARANLLGLNAGIFSLPQGPLFSKVDSSENK